MRAYRAKCSTDAMQKEASCKRAYKTKKTLKPKEKACGSQSSLMKQYRTNSKASCIQDFLYKFHNIVSQGSMYTCSCCDQLWYRHSVNSAHKLRKSNPSVDKYLLNRPIFVYTFCLINICLSLSDDANKIKTLNIERA